MDLNQEVANALEVLQNGGIILYPTDTVWGIGCDASNEKAVAKIYELKKRAETKSMIVLVNGERLMHNTFKEIPEVAWQIMDLSEKPTTLVLDKPQNVALNLVADDNTLAVRLVKETFCYKLIEKLKKPLVSTSANISGNANPNTYSEISNEIKNGVDYIVNLSREKKCGNPSTIIKIGLDNVVKIIRK